MNRLGEFILDEYRAMVGYVRNRIEDEADREAEDIVQDVIVHLFDRVDPGYSIENLAAYIYRALRNKIIDVFRKRKDKVALSDVLEDSSINVDDDVEKRELLEQVFSILDELDDDEKAIVLASEFEGWSYRDLSKKWNVPEGTLMARKKRALDKVRLRMKSSQQTKIKGDIE